MRIERTFCPFKKLIFGFTYLTKEMKLTADQEEALANIILFVRSPVKKKEDCAGILYAAAGCGKTFLTRVIVQKLRNSHRIAGVAPTHKARKVLDSFLNKDSLIKVQTITIASLLNKLRSHSYIGTKHYTGGADSKIHLFDLFLVDEASMITDADVQLIINHAYEFKRKILFIGDNHQIPNPSQKYICERGLASKRDSMAFKLPHRFELTTNLRQAENNPIINLYTEFRDAIRERREPNISRKDDFKDGFGVKFFTKKNDWYAVIEETFLNLKTPIHNIRILAYTNDTVRNHNLMLRKLFNRGEAPEVGELLMGYNNLGWPVKTIENSQDYYVTSVGHTNLHTITLSDGQVFRRLVGNLVGIREPDATKEAILFIPDLRAPENQSVLQELVARAERVNRRRSTKEDFKRYSALKDKLVFMENVYKFGDEVVGEGEFRSGNPLLFKSVSDTIEDLDDGERSVLDNKLSRDLKKKYGNLLDDRVSDDKVIAGTEKFCDRYCVIEKDIDYGVCITAHKSQGSNFKTVFIDEADFDKLHNHWSYTLDCQVDVVKERNQLKYVSYTRPTDSAFVFYRE